MTKSLEEIRAILASELARIDEPSRRATVQRCLVEPELRMLAWDYGVEDQRHACWLIGLCPDLGFALAYCDEGFGPSFPWGYVFSERMGMDAQWHSGLEDAVIGAGLLRAPPGYQVPGPRAACGHGLINEERLVCAHRMTPTGAQHHVRFTGRGVDYALVCPACADAPETSLVTVCEACAMLVEQGEGATFLGAPEIRVRPSPLRFVHEEVALSAPSVPLRAFGPLPGRPRSRWLGVADGELLGFDLDDSGISHRASLRAAPLDLDEPLAIHASPCGRFAAVVNQNGRRGAVVDLVSGNVTLPLDRGRYHETISRFSVGFVRRGDRTLVVHATDWNRLDISDPATAELLTRRDTAWREGEPRPSHHLDYFHGGLVVSPDGAFLADGGWVWHPMGAIRTWDLRRWLDKSPFESEDGRSLRVLSYRDPWDVGMCFVDGCTLAVWGFGHDQDAMIPAVQLFDVESGERLSWFAGVPDGTFAFDRWLFCTSPVEGTSVWDVATGERVAADRALTAAVCHPDAHELVTPLGGGRFRRSWLQGS